MRFLYTVIVLSQKLTMSLDLHEIDSCCRLPSGNLIIKEVWGSINRNIMNAREFEYHRVRKGNSLILTVYIAECFQLKVGSSYVLMALLYFVFRLSDIVVSFLNNWLVKLWTIKSKLSVYMQ